MAEALNGAGVESVEGRWDEMLAVDEEVMGEGKEKEIGMKGNKVEEEKENKKSATKKK